VKIISKKHTDDGQTIDICGLDNQNRDATNEISWLILDALEEIRTFEPKPVIKYTTATDKKFMQKCYEIIASGLALPAISYHEVGARGLRSYENLFTEEDIINHSHIGCVELGIPGKSYTDPMNGFINLPKILLITMNNGDYNGRKIGKELSYAATWDEFLNNFDEQLNYFIGLYVKGMNDSQPFYSQYFHRPLISTIVENCIEKAIPVDNGGSRYWVKGINCTGLATTVDSLYSIKKLVYEDKQFRMEGLYELLICNYEGNEDLRQMIKNRLPKYGNGVEEVDNIAKSLVNRYSKAVRSYKTFNGNSYRPGLYSFYGPIKRMGKITSATPDGRKAKEVFSLNCAPGHGNIKNGLSAALQSIITFDHSMADNASTVDIQLSSGVTGDIIKYINEYLADKDVLYTQITVANREDMLKAQRNPEYYQDLIVRVSGFSARFISLDKETQDEIIQRSYWI
jgi:pyruvate-formate lyase